MEAGKSSSEESGSTVNPAPTSSGFRETDDDGLKGPDVLWVIRYRSEDKFWLAATTSWTKDYAQATKYTPKPVNLPPGGVAVRAEADKAETSGIPLCDRCGTRHYKWDLCAVTVGEVLEKVTQKVPPVDALDKQIGGDHYKDFEIQPIEFIQKNGLDFCEGNAVKYVCRHKAKGGKADIEKAIHYLEMLLELEYGTR